MKTNSLNTGFSLVELSIVLVILGLLVGGILAGQSLIRASELRAVSAEYQRYTTAMMAFRDKYFAYPGDFRDATRFWGRQNSNADCFTNSSASVTTPGVCDGNGDGSLLGGLANTATERHQFWRHLAQAGLIEGTYSGLTATTGADACVVGTDCPRSKLSQAGWDTYRFGDNFAGDASVYAGNYGNAHFVFGGQLGGTVPETAILRPEEAWNIDTKLDDGRPGTGKIVPRYWNNACATSTSNTDYTGAYKLSDNTVQCMLYFRQLF